MTNAKRLRALRLADSMNNSTVRVFVKYEKSRDELEAENAKLRELIRDMGRVLDGCFPTNCMWHCPRFDGHCCDNGTDTCLFNKDIRELGVEVPE